MWKPFSFYSILNIKLHYSLVLICCWYTHFNLTGVISHHLRGTSSFPPAENSPFLFPFLIFTGAVEWAVRCVSRPLDGDIRHIKASLAPWRGWVCPLAASFCTFTLNPDPSFSSPLPKTITFPCLGSHTFGNIALITIIIPLTIITIASTGRSIQKFQYRTLPNALKWKYYIFTKCLMSQNNFGRVMRPLG